MFAILKDFKHIKRLLTKWKRNAILVVVKNLKVAACLGSDLEAAP